MDVTALNATLSGTSAPEEAAAGRPVFYTLGALGALVLASLVACLVVVAVYIRRRVRLEHLRHRLLPLYTYDPAEQEEEDWGGDEGGEEEQWLTETRQLVFSPAD